MTALELFKKENLDKLEEEIREAIADSADAILIDRDGDLTNAGCDQIARIARASIESFLETKLNVVLSKVAA